MITLPANYYGDIYISVYIAITLYIIHCKLMQQVRHMFDEIDYVLEGKNAERFASLYCSSSSKFNICGKISICCFFLLYLWHVPSSSVQPYFIIPNSKCSMLYQILLEAFSP